MVASTGQRTSAMSKAAEAVSAASSPGGKSGGTSSGGASSSAGSKSGPSDASKAAAAQAARDKADAAAKAAEAANKAAQQAHARAQSLSAGAQAAADAAAKAHAAANVTAMGQRGLLGGTIATNPTAAARSVGGLLSPNLAALDRATVEQQTAAGRKLGLDTGWGAIFSDRNRFNVNPRSGSLFPGTPAAKGSLGLGGLPTADLERLNRMQVGLGTPLDISSAHRSKAYNDALYAGYGKPPTNSQHSNSLTGAIDMNFDDPATLARAIDEARKVGFTGFGTYSNPPGMLHVDMGRPRGWGPGMGGIGPVAEAQQAAVAAAKRGGPTPNAPGTPGTGFAAPSLNNAVRTAAPNSIPGTGYQENPSRFAGIASPAPKMQDRLSPSGVAGMGFTPGLPGQMPSLSNALSQPAYNQRGVPSPMAGQGVPDNNALNSYADLGMRQALAPVSQRQTLGYDPLGSVRAPSAPPITAADVPDIPTVGDAARRTVGGLPDPYSSTNAFMPGARRSMGPEMARTDTPTSAWNSDVLGPIDPQQPSRQSASANAATGPSGYGGFPTSAPGPGMAFNPGLPGQMPSNSRSRSPFVSGPEPQVAGLPDQPGLETRNKTPATGFVGLGPISGKPKTQQVAELPQPGVPYSEPPPQPGVPYSEPPLNITNTPAPTLGPPPLDITNSPLKMPKNNLRQFTVGRLPSLKKGAPLPENYPGTIESSLLTAPIGAMMPLPGMVSGFLAGTNYLDNEMRNGRLGNLRDLPGGQLAHSQPRDQAFDQSGAYQGDQRASRPVAGSGPNGEWTGKESAGQVAQMQQNVEQVLRGYFVDTGFQYPQYTTGFA